MAEKVSIVTVCDRCGEDEKTPAGPRTKKNWPIPSGWFNLHQGTRKLDICPSCVTSFESWLAQPKVVAAENQDAAANATPNEVSIQVHLPDGVDTSVSRAIHNADVNLGMV